MSSFHDTQSIGVDPEISPKLHAAFVWANDTVRDVYGGVPCTMEISTFDADTITMTVTRVSDSNVTAAQFPRDPM
jgi:hypothetical protein